jgi:hypothetical protein
MLRAVLTTAVLATGVLFGPASAAQAQELVPCAREGGFCRVPYPTRVIYGARGANSERFVREGGIPCSNRAFGDPAPGRAKRCAFVSRGRDRGWDDDRRGPPRGPDRGFREDNGFYAPPRGRDRGFRDDDRFDGPFRTPDVY